MSGGACGELRTARADERRPRRPGCASARRYGNDLCFTRHTASNPDVENARDVPELFPCARSSSIPFWIVLVRRFGRGAWTPHNALVWRACRGGLGAPHDAA